MVAAGVNAARNPSVIASHATQATGVNAHAATSPLATVLPAAGNVVSGPMATASLAMLENAHLEIVRLARRGPSGIALRAASGPSVIASHVRMVTVRVQSVHSATSRAAQSPSVTSLAKAVLLAASQVALVASRASASRGQSGLRAGSVARGPVVPRVPAAKVPVAVARVQVVNLLEAEE